MIPLLRRHFLHAALLLAVSAPLSAVRADPGGVALMGYDAVAYFRHSEALPGAGNIALRWRGLVWHFASAENRAAFEADPRAYAPQFGGLCPVALTRGEVMAGDPRHWTIRDGKLYLSASPDGLARLHSDPGGIINGAAQQFRAIQGR